MGNRQITTKQIEEYGALLEWEERASGTVEKYLRDIRAFANWLDGRPVTKETAAAWKGQILDSGYAPVTINAMLSALNGFFHFLGWEDCRVKFLRVQRRSFREQKKELTKNEYLRLLETANKLGRKRLALLLETICATGIRVSEVRYITVEAARQGRAEIALKGKIRVILLPDKLCRKLLKYAEKQKTASGGIFLTRNGKNLSRQQIWVEMKRLCEDARVEASKVFPHNLRHLFAVSFYRACRDIARLADVLGHSSIETTRIYLLTTGTEHIHQLNRLGLVN